MSGEPAPQVSGADIRTFLFADMRGYTRFTQEHGDDAASALAGRFADLVRETVPEFEGELLELRGDEALCVFRSARQAVRAAVALQRALRSPREDAESFPLGVGMGLDCGEAVPTHGGYRGAALNRAARLCSMAKGGEILATEGVVHLTGPVAGTRMSDVRTGQVKGIAGSVRFVRVEPTEALPPPPSPPRRSRFRTRLVVPVAAALVALVAGIATMLGGGSGGGAKAGVVIRPDSVAAIDPRSGRVLADYPVPVGTLPAPLLYADGVLWTYNRVQRSLIQLDPKTGRHQVKGIGVAPTDLAVGDGYEWIAGGADNRIYRYQWGSLTPPEPIDLPRMRGSPVASLGEGPGEIGQVAVHGSEVFATAQGIDWPQTIAVYNTSMLRLKRVYRLPIRSRQIGDIEAGTAGVWIENRIQLFTGEEKAALASVFPHLGPPLYVLQGQYLQQGVAVAPLSVWFAPGKGQTVIALNPATNERFAVVTPADPVTAVSAGGAGIWAAASRLAALFKLDPTTKAVSLTVRLPRTSAAYITGLAVGPNRVWALIQGSPIRPGWPCPTPTCHLP